MAAFRLDSVLDALNRFHQRATYGAVSGILGTNPRSVLQGRPKDWRHSWVVNQATGLPTAYHHLKVHPSIRLHYVKNQYFADRRDMVKYDLLLDLTECLEGRRRLAFVPMLTPNDGSGEGNITTYQRGGRRQILYDSLRQALETGQRDIRLLRLAMPKLGVEFMPYRDDEWFEHATRSDYFSAIPADDLAASVIFVDPDIGLQTGTPGYMRRQGFEKYLMYSELSETWAKASGDSILVVYQHLQKDATKRASDVERRLRELKGHLKCEGLWALRSNDLAFLVVAGSRVLSSRTRVQLRDHAQRHGLEFSEG